MKLTVFRWQDPEAEVARAIRFRVFVEEQLVPAEEEIDALDEVAVHVLALGPDGVPTGTGRLFADPKDSTIGKIGRMAVEKSARGTGVGSAMLVRLMMLGVEMGFHELRLDSQVHAIPFYARHGFTEFGEEHLDAGIPHRWMRITREEAAAFLAR